tara:strand:+ start:229 stop:453 length:225 start_codon:yes stop_codon:yes gene_type:complete
MIKVFIFSLVICSGTMQTCTELPGAAKVYDNYKDCVLNGYQYSLDYLSIYDENLLTNNRVYTIFKCKESLTQSS